MDAWTWNMGPHGPLPGIHGLEKGTTRALIWDPAVRDDKGTTRALRWIGSSWNGISADLCKIASSPNKQSITNYDCRTTAG